MLKFFAALIMLIDHLTLALVPSSMPLYWLGRGIGRLAMPIFAYSVAQGFIHTHDLKKYLKRIGIMTLFAQIPITWLLLVGDGANLNMLFSFNPLANYFTHWNIGLTFMCALLVLYFYEKLEASSTQANTKPNLMHLLLYILGILFFSVLSSFGDYGLYGVAIVILFYKFLKGQLNFLKLAFYMILATFILMGPGGFLIELPAVFSLLLIKYVPETGIRLPKRFFYIFYPLHQLIIALLGALF